MSIESDDLLKLLPGTRVEAREHGDNEGCLCSIKGSIQTLDKRYANIFVGTSTWHLLNSDKRVRLSGVTILEED